MASRFSAFLVVAAALSASAAIMNTLSPPNSAGNPLRMWQTTPGVTYNDSFLIGNGRLGFSLPGTALSEAIVLNEDSFWSGGKMDRVNPDAAANMPQIQQLVAQGKIEEASELASMAYKALPESVRNYDWLGKLTLTMSTTGNVTDYERWLDLGEGVAGVYYTVDDVAFKREYAASSPDQTIAVRLTANQSGAISFKLQQSRGVDLNRFQDYSSALDGDTALMGGGSMGSDAILFSSAFKVTISGPGSVRTIGETVVVTGADSATIYWSAWTTYRKAKDELRGAVLKDVRAAAAKGYDAIRAAHVKDYQGLSTRLDLSLGESSAEQRSKTTAQRLSGMATSFDPEMATLYFYFARYLLISSARPGTLPANLQGIWNNNLSPTWGSKYTININLQMNYWPALMTNLAELHDSLLQHIKLIHANGREVARKMYNASGSVCHHNTDIWGDCAPQDNWPSSTFWPSGLGWLVTHVYEHFLFTGDVAVLQEYYPVLRDAALFYVDFLTEYDGQLVTNPSLSPEIQYYLPNTTEAVAMTLGPTCDNSIVWEVFGLVLDTARVLGGAGVGARDDSNLLQRIEAARARLPPLRRDQHGGIAEFIHDYTEDEPGHRHFSHLFGLFPGSRISSSDATTFDAARKSLARRLDNGGGDTGWSRAWAVALAARLFDADGVGASYDHLLVNLTYPSSMLDVNPPSAFQLDGNYGGVTVVEALVQSHELVADDGAAAALGGDVAAHHLVRLLPALPRRWAEAGGAGHATGLLARGGFRVDVHWDAQAELTNATLTSLQGATVWLTLGNAPIGSRNGTRAAELRVDGHGDGLFVRLETEKGKSYHIGKVSSC